MSASLTLRIKQDHEEIDRMTAAIEDLAEQDGWPPDLLFKVNLALEELGLNIMDYGLESPEQEIEIALRADEDSLVIEIMDEGRPFDPLTDAPEPDLSLPIEDRRVGGLGIHLVRTMMDDMQYRREQGRNHLTLVTRKTA